MMGHKICLFGEIWKIISKLYLLLLLIWSSDCGSSSKMPLSLTVITLNIGTPRPATVVVLNIKQFNVTLK